MAATEDVSDQTGGINQILEFGRIYYTKFSFIDALPDSGIIRVGKGKDADSEKMAETKGTNSIRASSSRTQIHRSTTFFSLSAAVMDITDITENPLDSTDLVVRILDILFRGRRDDILSCLNAIAPKLVTISVEKKAKYNKYICTFTEEYLKAIRGYTDGIYVSVMNNSGLPENCDWISVARSIFDFFRFRCMPEWYLLMRRILRYSPLTEKQKEQVYGHLFSGSANMWFAINYYFLWLYEKNSGEKARSSFAKALGAYINPDATDRVIGEMIASGLCRMTGRLLLVQPHAVDFVTEYIKEVNHECQRLRQSMDALTSPVSPS